VGVFTLAVLTDFFDGLVARIKKEKSELGQIIDPLADKLLLVTAFISLYLLDFKIPLLIVLVVVSRDAVMLLGFFIIYFLKIELPIAPSMWGKLTTFFQMMTIFCVLLDFPFAQIVWTAAAIFTLISGIAYFARGVRAINDRIGNNNRDSSRG
jgi:cardiolipin synthase